jgi:trans-2,3-dihydro-3-hydroxyanthranilate isomerase
MDVFTSVKYGGNQLAIFPDARRIEENLLQKIAREMNLSETVFIYPPLKNDIPTMRIFTPTQELPTAGHPTVGTAFYLSREVDHDTDRPLEMTLRQKIGDIKVRVDFRNNTPSMATMYQPLPDFGRIHQNRSEIAQLIGLSSEDLLDFPIQRVSCGVPYVIIPVKNIASIRNIRFRLDIWDQMKDDLDAFIYAFCPEGQEDKGNLHGRMFAPEAGILEDPATGSANGPLGCYVHHYKIAKSPYVSEQGFELGRPSILYIEINEKDENGDIVEVKVGGESVFVGSGEIYLD